MSGSKQPAPGPGPGPPVLARGAACGKVLLVGEHAVVHGHPALVAGLDRGVRCCLRRGADGDGPRLVAPGWGIDRVLQPQRLPDQALLAQLQATGQAQRRDLVIELDAELPPRMGLGSSAALGVALARALLTLAGTAEPTREQVERLAGCSEALFHGRASGVDVLAASRGGVQWFRPGAPPEALRLRAPLPLVLIYTPAGPPTSTMVARVAEGLRREPALGAALARLGALAGAARQFLLASDRPALGRVLDSAQTELVTLGVSTPALDEAVDEARRAGALGAKLSGGGGGGVALALPPGDAAPLAAALAARGLAVQAVLLGGPPVAAGERVDRC